MRGITEGPVDFVLLLDEKWDEGSADGSRCACQEDFHGRPFSHGFGMKPKLYE
jgi:hypothetical protein